MKTKFNDDLFRLCHPVGQLRELNRRADLGAIEEKLADLSGVPHEQITGAVALALAHQQLATLREFARTNNPTERDLNCYVILCKLTELSCACKHLIADGLPGGEE